MERKISSGVHQCESGVFLTRTPRSLKPSLRVMTAFIVAIRINNILQTACDKKRTECNYLCTYFYVIKTN